MTITVYNLVGEFAVAADDGQKLYEQITDSLRGREHIDLDFDRVRVVATPFFNAAIGRLLKDHAESPISFKNLSAVGQNVLAKVIENAKQYYHGDPAAREALDKILVEHTEDH